MTAAIPYSLQVPIFYAELVLTMAQQKPAQAIVQEPVEEGEEEQEYVTATIAKSAEYRLKEKDLETLVCKRVPNPRNCRAAPMRLYIRSASLDTCGPLSMAWDQQLLSEFYDFIPCSCWVVVVWLCGMSRLPMWRRETVQG